MFSMTTQSEVLVGPARDAFVGMNQKERVVRFVSRPVRWLFGDGRHDVGIGVSRIDPGDVRLDRGGA
jgi:hypothetical protein